MDILETIVAHKRTEIAAAKATVPVEVLKQQPLFSRTTFSLKQTLQDADKTGIIAEFKRESPSKGVINGNATVTEVTAAYTQHGAACLSVLTDEKFFGGSAKDLEEARINNIPILRKDFMVDEYQFYEAKAMGADVVLLIAACLTPEEVKLFATLAKSLGLEVLLEIHNEAELIHICDEVDFVGVNNRNLKTFEVDIQTSLNLVKHIPQDKPAIAESGISNVDTIVTLKRAGFKGFLIGENFMKQVQPSIAFAEFVKALHAAQL